MKPPKCKTCDAEEWSHICGGIPEAKERLAVLSKPIIISKPKPASEVIAKAAKFDRAAYMRDRHAKRKLEAESKH